MTVPAFATVLSAVSRKLPVEEDVGKSAARGIARDRSGTGSCVIDARIHPVNF
jgi:hypothetical protein